MDIDTRKVAKNFKNGPLESMTMQKRCWIKIYFNIMPTIIWGLPRCFSGKNPFANAVDTGDFGFHPWVGKTLWRRKWQPTPVFLPGKFHGQMNLVGYLP